MANKKPTFAQFNALIKISIVLSCCLVLFGICLFIWYLSLKADYTEDYEDDYAALLAWCEVYGRPFGTCVIEVEYEDEYE